MIHGADDLADSEGSSESGDKPSEAHEEGDLEYVSDRGQVTAQNTSDFEKGNIPQLPTLSEVEGHSTSHESHPVMRNSPGPSPTPPIPHVDASTNNHFTIDAPETRAGRKRKTRDLHSMLVVCMCGQAVSESEILQNRDVIKCRRIGCETSWVSQNVK